MPDTRIRFAVVMSFCVGAVWFSSAWAARPELEEAVGVADAVERYGDRTPTGRGVPVGQVEGDQGGNYAPRATGNAVFVNRSGKSGASGHATNVARLIFGNDGLAPGVPLVHAFSAGDWIGTGYLKTGTLSPPGDDIGLRLFNHSWVSRSMPQATKVLRRVDFLIDETDLQMCVGVDNGGGSRVPDLLAPSYNAIAVGNTSGKSSAGYTKVDTEGRCKPDVVAPTNVTSNSTAVVTGVVARLMEGADRIAEERPAATRSEVIKAALLTAATKPPKWKPEEGHPLDSGLGAGTVHLGHSLDVLWGGAASTEGVIDRLAGWDFTRVDAGAERVYRFRLPEGAASATLTLVWNRRIQGGTVRVRGKMPDGDTQEVDMWLDLPRTTNLDLLLTREAGAGEAVEVASSTSRVDNVEHLHLLAPEPGNHTLTIRRGRDRHDESWEYALAWRVVMPGEASAADTPSPESPPKEEAKTEAPPSLFD